MATVPSKKRLRGKGGLVMMGMALILIIAFIIDQKAPPPREPDTQPPISDYVHAAADDVNSIQVKRADSGFTLARQGKDWAIRAPRALPANTDVVNTWLKGVLDATISQPVDGKPGADVTGLDKPQVELVLQTRGGPRTLQIGKDFATAGQTTGSVYYAREARDGRVFMVSSSQVTDLKDKKVTDLRDKRLLAIADDKKVTQVAVQGPKGTLQVVRSGDKWQLQQPFAAPADDFAVDDVIRDARSDADSYVEQNAGAGLARYGLDTPRLTVTVTDDKGPHVLLLGKEKDGKVYAMRQGDGEIALAPKATFTALDKGAGDLRDKKLISLDSDKINSVELTNAGGAVKLRKTGDNTWQFGDVTDPKQRNAKADAVQNVLTSATASAAKWVDEAPADLAKYGLDKPQITLTVHGADGKTETLTVGKKTQAGNYYAKGAGTAVFEVQPFVYTDLNVKRGAFQDASAK